MISRQMKVPSRRKYSRLSARNHQLQLNSESNISGNYHIETRVQVPAVTARTRQGKYRCPATRRKKEYSTAEIRSPQKLYVRHSGAMRLPCDLLLPKYYIRTGNQGGVNSYGVAPCTDILPYPCFPVHTLANE